MLYKVIPDVELSWKDVWVGGAIALLFTLGKYLLGLYLALGTVVRHMARPAPWWSSFSGSITLPNWFS